MSRVAQAIERVSAPIAAVRPILADRLTVRDQRTLALQPRDEAALDELVESRPDIGVFASRAWLSGFFAEPQPGVEPALALVREGTALRGVVPIGIRATATHVRASLLGGASGSDRVELLAARGYEAAAADAFLGWLGATFGPRGFLLELRDVPASSPLWGAIHRAGIERTQRLVLQPREVNTLPYLTLNDLRSDRLRDCPSSRSLQSLENHRR